MHAHVTGAITWQFASTAQYVLEHSERETGQARHYSLTRDVQVLALLVGVGYIGLPEVANRVFVDYEGNRGYRTGDLMRMCPTVAWRSWVG